MNDHSRRGHCTTLASAQSLEGVADLVEAKSLGVSDLARSPNWEDPDSLIMQP